jgi:hypothetical protein
MIIFLYLVLVLAWAFLIIILKCKKARAKRLAEQEEEMAQQVHVVQIGSNLYDIMAVSSRNYGTNYGYGATRNRSAPPDPGRGHTTSVTHSNPAFVDDNGGCVFPTNNLGEIAR